jgi:hypothetical protein
MNDNLVAYLALFQMLQMSNPREAKEDESPVEVIKPRPIWSRFCLLFKRQPPHLSSVDSIGSMEMEYSRENA